MSATHVVTGPVICDFPNLFKPHSYNGDETSAKYDVVILIDKDDRKTLSAIKAGIEAATQKGVSDKWKGKKPAKLWNPLRDGDEEKGDDYPEFKEKMFITAKSGRRPKVVDRDLTEILDSEEIYSGCKIRVSLDFYPFDTNGNRGIAAGLANVQKWADGERLGGGGAKAEDDFGDSFEEEEEEEF